jgi:PAS domain S-box-containing protein
MKVDTVKHLVEGKYSIKDLVDLKELRALFQSFTDAMGFTIGFLSTPELETLIATGWRDICTKYHRRCPLAATRCRTSNARLVQHLKRPGQIVIEACENGLVDCATPIIVKGKTIAILATGQVLLKPPSIEYFKKQAKLFGCNEAVYLSALKKVPVIPGKKLKKATRFLGELAHTVIRMGYAGLAEKERGKLLAFEIDQRKKIEGDLREAASQREVLFGALRDGVIVAEADAKKILEVNDEACRIFGYTRAEFLKKRVFDLHPKKDLERVLAYFRELSQKKKDIVLDVPCRKKGGAIFPADIVARPTMFEGKKCLVGFFRDASGRKLAEEQKLEAARRLQAVFDSAFQFIALLKPDGKVLEVNASALRFGGLAPRDVRDKFFWDCLWWTISKQAQQGVREAVAQAAKGRFVRYPVEILGDKGATVTIDFSLKPVRNEKGRVVLLTAEGRDITDIKRAQEGLKRAVSLERATLESTEDGILVVERDTGKIADFNDRFVELWRVPKKILEEGDDQKLFKHVLPQLSDPRKFLSGVARLYRFPRKDSFDVLKFKDGRVFERYSRPQCVDGDPVGRVWSFRDVTERKRMEESLRKNEIEKRMVLENIPDLVVYQDTRNKILWANSSTEKAFGKTAEELKGAACYKLFHNRSRPCTGCPVNKSKKTGCLEYAEMVSPDGRHWMISGSPVKDASGTVTGIVEVAIDITENKRNEHDILASEARYRRLFEAAKDGILILSAETGMIEDVNPYLVELLGYSHKVFLGKKIWDLGFFRDIVPNKAHFLQLQQKKYVRYDDMPLETADGGKISVEFVSNVYTVDGQTVIQCNIRNITERKGVAEILRESQALLNETGKMAHVGGWKVDVKTWRLKWTDEVFNIHEVRKNFRPTVERAIGFYAPSSRPVILRAVRRAIRFGEPFDLELEVITAKGRRLWVQSTGKAIRESGKTRIIAGTFQDITERKRAEKALRESEERFRLVINNSSDLVYRRNIQTGRYDFFSPASKKILGLTPKELIGKELTFAANRIHPDDLKGVMLVLKRAQTGHLKKGIVDYRCRHKDGSYRWLSDRFSVVDDVNGRPLYWVGVSRDVTEAKKAEEALRAGEERLRLQLRRMPVACILLSQDFRVMSWNPAAEKIFGYKTPEAEGRKIFELIVPKAAQPKVDLIRRRLLQGDASANNINENVTKSGETIFCKWTNTPLRDGEGKIFAILSMAEDITRQQQAEELLRSSEERFRRFAVASACGFAMGELSGQLIFANAATLRLVEEKREKDFTRKTFFQYYLPEDAKRLKKEILPKVIEAGHWAGEIPLLSAKGNLVSTEQNIFLVRDEQGVPRMVGNIITDITERKRAEDALIESRRQLRQIIDTVPHMIFAKDKDGRFLLVNRATAAAYQKEPKELIGVRRRDIHKDRGEVESFQKSDREVLSSGKPMLFSSEPFTDSRGHKHILQTIKIPFKIAGIQDMCILGVSVDVTEQKKVEEFRNDIVRTVSHELRTPLSIEKEGISLLMDEVLGPVTAGQKEILETVMRSIDRLARMITSLLDISTIETGKIHLQKKMTNLVDLVKDAAFEFKKRAGVKGVDLGVKLPEHEVQILVDPDKITQVLSNLVDNAIKFTEKGSVEISLTVLEDAVECEVRDTGIGIAPENVAKAFEKFQQFSRTAGPGEKGFGLGLSICKGIIGMHGGRIWLKSQLGQGTQVTFTLPFFPKKGG